MTKFLTIDAVFHAVPKLTVFHAAPKLTPMALEAAGQRKFSHSHDGAAETSLKESGIPAEMLVEKQQTEIERNELSAVECPPPPPSLSLFGERDKRVNARASKGEHVRIYPHAYVCTCLCASVRCARSHIGARAACMCDDENIWGNVSAVTCSSMKPLYWLVCPLMTRDWHAMQKNQKLATHNTVRHLQSSWNNRSLSAKIPRRCQTIEGLKIHRPTFLHTIAQRAYWVRESVGLWAGEWGEWVGRWASLSQRMSTSEKNSVGVILDA